MPIPDEEIAEYAEDTRTFLIAGCVTSVLLLLAAGLVTFGAVTLVRWVIHR